MMKENPSSQDAGCSGEAGLAPAEQTRLLEVARRAVVAAVEHAPPPVLPSHAVTPALSRPQACFVTLRHGLELRGCIGQLQAREPLWQAVVANAQGAAVRDFRFSPVSPNELSDLRIEISVLSAPVPLHHASPEELLERLRPHVDGVVLRIGDRVSTFLPQVWEDLPLKVQFLEHLATKAGCDAQAWRGETVGVEVYQVQHFDES